MRVAVSAGFDKSLPALLMADRLRDCGHEVVAVLVVSPYSMSRLGAMLRSRGVSGVRKALGKLLKGTERANSEAPNAIERLAAESGLEHRSLKSWCAHHSIPRYVLRSINEPDAVRAIEQAGAQALVYGGGGILRAPIIESVGGNVLNPHAGPLPEIRGMNAIEWATVLGERRHITVHFIDTGIDTGGVLAEAPVPVARGDSVMTLRAKAVAAGVRALTDLLDGTQHPGQLTAHPNRGASAGRQCYTMSPALLELVEARLAMDR